MRLKELKAIPSFFSGHIHYFGDSHYSTFLGPQRALRISPVAWALKNDITYTLHTDSPVVRYGIIGGKNTVMQTMAAAVNRRTKANLSLDLSGD